MALWDSFGGAGSTVLGWMTSFAFWIFIIVFIIVFFIFGLYIRKRRKLNITVLKMYDRGYGNVDFVTTKGGWFKARFMLGGLWDYGNEFRFRLADMTPVDNVSHNDYRNINGKKGLAVICNPNDQKMVFPISRYFISKDSRAVMAEVAPADYRDSASKSIEAADQEMSSKWAQYAPMIITGLVVVIAFIITLLNTQYGKYMVDKALETIEIVKNTPCVAIPSSGAP